MSSIIQVDPHILGGTPCFAGTRVPIKALYDHFKLGYNVDQFLEEFPTVERHQVEELLDALEHDLHSPAKAAG
jgi:uncharacterized protein (DUF433 family)